MVDASKKGIASRLALLVKERGITQETLGAAADKSKQAASGWLKTGRISNECLQMIANEYSYHLTWLLSGVGEKRISQDYVAAKIKFNNKETLTIEEAKEIMAVETTQHVARLASEIREASKEKYGLEKVKSMADEFIAGKQKDSFAKAFRIALDLAQAPESYYEAVFPEPTGSGSIDIKGEKPNPFSVAVDILTNTFPDKTLINIYENIEASAGDGAIVGHEFPTDHLWVENKWLEEIVPFVPKEMAIIKVKGDSMEPTLSPGDMILIDRQPIERNQINDGVYIINRNGTTHVKRLQTTEQGIRIISDNKALYDPETVTDGLTICGRVIWAWRGKRF